MKKSRWFLPTVLSLGLLGLGGCSASDSGSSVQSSDGNSSSSEAAQTSEEIVVTLWHYYNGSTKDTLDKLIREFNDTLGKESTPNIRVEATSSLGVSDLASDLVASAQGEVGMADLPHIFAAYTDTALLLDDMGKVASLDGYFTQGELDSYHQDFLEEGRFDKDGNLKIIPVAKSTEQLFLNTTDFEVFSQATGVEMKQLSTWEGLVEVAEIYYHWTDSLTEEEGDGRAFYGIDSEANFMLLASKQLGNEFYLYEEDGVSFALTQENAKRIWDVLMVPYFKGYFGSYGSYRSDDVKSGDILAYTGSTSSVYYFPSAVQLGRSEAYDIQGTALPYPYFEGGDPVVVQQGAGMVVSLSQEVTQKAATTFLKWFTEPENNLEFAVSTGYMPVQNDALSLEGVLSVMTATADSGVPQVVLDCQEVTYLTMLPNYQFYNNKPFDGSYDTRSAIVQSVAGGIDQGIAYYKEQAGAGVLREVILEDLCGEESFQTWYQSLTAEMEGILN